MTAAGPSAKRPPHIGLERASRSLVACSLIVCLPLAAAGCHKAKPAAEQASGPETTAPASTGALSPSASLFDRSHKGSPMPAMPFEAPGGGPATLTTFRGQPVLVNLWATWCGPCVKELPTLDRLATQERGKLKVVAVSEDAGGQAQVQPFWRAHGLTALTPYTDPKMALMGALRIDSLPTTILYDAHGREVWRVVGGKDWTASDVRGLLAEAQ